MNRYVVTLHLTVTGPVQERITHVEHVTDCYAELEKANDQLLDAAWSMTDQGDYVDVEFEATVETDNEGDGYNIARSSARAAIHHAGGYTPGWDDVAGVGQVQYRLAREEAVPVG